MKRFRRLSVIVSAMIILLLSCCTGPSRYFRFEGFAQGGTWHIICELPSSRPGDIRKISQGIDTLFNEIDASVSGYNRGSLISRFNAGEAVVPDCHFAQLFKLSEELYHRTEGAFDPSAGPLFDLWGFGFAKSGSAPSRSDIDSVLEFTGMHHFKMTENGAIERDDPRCRLNFNAIAQGYTCDVLASFLMENGCANFLVEVGGEIVCRGLKADGELWSVVCDAPGASKDTLRLTDCAVVTSGNYRKNGESDGKKYGHIIDPRSGNAVPDVDASSTVIVTYEESDWPASVADALATASVVCRAR